MKNENPICTAMAWPTPGRRERLVISHNGRWIAHLMSAKPDQFTFEGLYLLDDHGRTRGSCLAIVGEQPAEMVRDALAQKLGIGAEQLAELHVDIVAP